MKVRVLVVVCLVVLGGVAGRLLGLDGTKDAGTIVSPAAVVQTTPVPHGGDAADDPAIWVHPTDGALSMIIGTDKHGGLISYDMEGKQLEIVSEAARPNNVDVIYDVALGGRKVDIAVAGCRNPQSLGLKFWSIDRETRKLADVTAGGCIAVFGHTEPYGTGVYHSVKSGKNYVFVNNKKGGQEQYEITDAGEGRVGAVKVRSFKLESETEGCVCDDEMGWVYIAEEQVGIWRFSAEPDGGDKGVLVTECGKHGLKGDVEGLTLYCGRDGKGYLIASSQGNSTYKVYERGGQNAFVCTIIPKDGEINRPTDTDGIAVSNRPLGPQFGKGALVVQDGVNKHGNQNFKLYRWEDIAGDRLTVDTGWDSRKIEDRSTRGDHVREK